jgi:hypothetical protein
MAEENLKALANLNPYSQGSVGFDNRYEGVKGSPRLNDTLLHSFLKIRGQDSYVELMADLDIVSNSVIYIHPKTRQIFSVPLNMISEIIINKEGNDVLYRPTTGVRFGKEPKEVKFYQLLKAGRYQLMKVPGKVFMQANYKGAYSPDRRYDEFLADDKYYLPGPDSIFYQIQLNKKAVAKIYPDKKSVIEKAASRFEGKDKEALILAILEEL